MRNSKAKGFTLIELIVVMAIIGVLAAILVPSMIGYLNDSKYSKANANAKQVYQSAANWCTKCETQNHPVNKLAAAATDLTTTGKANKDIAFNASADYLKVALLVYMGGQPNSGNGCVEIENSAPKWAQWNGEHASGSDAIFGQYPGELNAHNADGKTYGSFVST